MKELPHDRASEIAFLGSLIEFPDKWDLTDGVRPVDFYYGDTKAVYEAILHLGRGCDVRMVEKRLEDLGFWETHTDRYGLMSSLQIEATSNIKLHANQIVKLSYRRSLIDKCTKIANQAYDMSSVEEQIDTGFPGFTGGAENSMGIYTGDMLEEKVFKLHEVGLGRALETGWDQLNEHYKLVKKQHTVITGTPNAGKSSFLKALLINMHKIHGWKFGVMSAEDSLEECWSDFASIYLQKPFFDGPNERISQLELAETITKKQNDFILLEMDDEDNHFDTILSKLRIAIERYELDAVAIDPWNKVNHRLVAGQTMKDYIKSSLNKWDRFVEKNNVHGFIVAHPTKLQKTYDKKGEFYYYPIATEYDIDGASDWNNISDNIISIYVPYDSFGETLKGKAEIHVRKIRRRRLCGIPGMANFDFDYKTGVYS